MAVACKRVTQLAEERANFAAMVIAAPLALMNAEAHVPNHAATHVMAHVVRHAEWPVMKTLAVMPVRFRVSRHAMECA